MTKAPKPCADCGIFEKLLPRHFCAWCQLKRLPMHEQVEHAQRRLEAIPEQLRMKRSQKVIKDDTPAGMAFCAGCQSFCPDWYFGKSATQCRACTSAKAHASRTERVYGIDADEYSRILLFQNGRCAICRNKPQSERLAVDHDHKTGKVRGLLNSRCNHEALGALHDEPQAAWNAFLYLSTPPATLENYESWEAFLEAHPMPGPHQLAKLAEPEEDKPRPQPWDQDSGEMAPFSMPGTGREWKPRSKPEEDDDSRCVKGLHYLPVGSASVPGKRGVWYYFAEDTQGTDAPF